MHFLNLHQNTRFCFILLEQMLSFGIRLLYMFINYNEYCSASGC